MFGNKKVAQHMCEFTNCHFTEYFKTVDTILGEFCLHFLRQNSKYIISTILFETENV